MWASYFPKWLGSPELCSQPANRRRKRQSASQLRGCCSQAFLGTGPKPSASIPGWFARSGLINQELMLPWVPQSHGPPTKFRGGGFEKMHPPKPQKNNWKTTKHIFQNTLPLTPSLSSLSSFLTPSLFPLFLPLSPPSSLSPWTWTWTWAWAKFFLLKMVFFCASPSKAMQNHLEISSNNLILNFKTSKIEPHTVWTPVLPKTSLPSGCNGNFADLRVAPMPMLFDSLIF